MPNLKGNREVTSIQAQYPRVPVLLSPSSSCSPHNRPIDPKTRCWGKGQGLYSESQQTGKMVDLCPKETCCLGQNQPTLILNRERVWLVIVNFLVLESFVLFYSGHAMQHAGSQFPDQGLNPCPLQWKRKALTAGPPGKPLESFVLAAVHVGQVTMFL